MFDDSKFLKKYIIFDVCCTLLIAFLSVYICIFQSFSQAYLGLALSLIGFIRISYYVWKYKRQIQTHNQLVTDNDYG